MNLFRPDTPTSNTGQETKMADSHNVDPAACYGIISHTEGQAEVAKRDGTTVSSDIDALASACTGRSSSISSALLAAYHRALDPALTKAVTQVDNAIAGGRGAVRAIQDGHEEMAANSAWDARAVDTVEIPDRK